MFKRKGDYMIPFVGEIRMFGGKKAPRGWAFCDGQLMSISQNEMLFVLIGTKYGGDGIITFALPDLRGRVALHQGNNGMTTYLIGQKGGQETVTLSENMLPAHTHSVAVSISNATVDYPENTLWATSNAKLYSIGAPEGTMKTDMVTETGGNQPHNNMMPYLTVSYIIALTGIFPQRT